MFLLATNRNHYNWLQMEKKVLDHDFPSKSGILTLYFRVQFFTESINQLRDSITIELFYLQAKESVFKVSFLNLKGLKPLMNNSMASCDAIV